jgi:hypothetical protein
MIMQNADATLAVHHRRLRFGCWAAILALAAIVALVGIGVWWVIHEQTNWTVAQIEELIQSELPAASTKAQVEAWFNSHNFSHDYCDATVAMDQFGNQTVAQEAGVTESKVQGRVRGVVGNASHTFLSHTHIYVYFFLDEQGKVIRHLVKPVVVEPSQ